MSQDMVRIDDRFIEQRCGRDPERLTPFEASELALEFDWLACWWLRRDVLERATEAAGIPGELAACWSRQPTLPAEPGACWVVVANQAYGPSLLRDAFVLPLRWVEDAADDLRLPPKLRSLAERVRLVLDKDEALPTSTRPASGWGLTRHAPEGQPPDLSGLRRLEWESAWAPLAGGLITAAHGARPDPGIWASGAWIEGHIESVEGLGAKLATARTWSARMCFLPDRQITAVSPAPPAGLELGPLRSDTGKVLAALDEYLLALAVPPDAQAPRQHRQQYYLRLRDDKRARAYFVERCLPEIAAETRHQLRVQLEPSPAELVTFASDSPEVIALAVATIQPRRCLVLHTPDYAAWAAEAIRLCGQAGCEFQTAAVERNERPSRFTTSAREAIEAFVAADADSSTLAFDLTPGPKDVALALAMEVAPAESPLLYFAHTMGPGKRPVPFTQQLRVFKPRGQVALA